MYLYTLDVSLRFDLCGIQIICAWGLQKDTVKKGPGIGPTMNSWSYAVLKNSVLTVQPAVALESTLFELLHHPPYISCSSGILSLHSEIMGLETDVPN